MSTDRTVLEHLLEGRDALLAEVARLNTAIAELDSVIVRIGGTSSATAAASTPAVEAAPVEPQDQPAAAPAKKAAARKAPARKAARRTVARSAQPEGGKSIRVHVLEMLGSENRDFGLAEIIDRIHGLGIAAHDDAVRSITIKLMKDGRVERVGRGQYRLARRGAAAAPATPPQATPVVPQSAPQGGYVPPLNFDQDPS